MTEQRTYIPFDPNDPKQMEKLEAILSVLTIDQALQLASFIREVSKSFGFGSVYIQIEKGHPSLIGIGEMDIKFSQELREEQAAALVRAILKGD